MPFGACGGFTPYALRNYFQEPEPGELMRADDDGMAQPYIRLEGIKTPRSLSWAEMRALRHDLQQSLAWYGPIVRSQTNPNDWSFRTGIIMDDPHDGPTTPEQRQKAIAWYQQFMQTPVPQEWCRCEIPITQNSHAVCISNREFELCDACRLPIFEREVKREVLPAHLFGSKWWPLP